MALRYGDQSVEVDVGDTGRTPALTAEVGHGLIGMRERVALYGGRFRASRNPAGGFTVHALLPIR